MKNKIKRKFIHIVLMSTSIFIGSAMATDNTGAYKNGEHVFAAVCSHCHDLGNGPKIKGRNLPQEYVKTRVRNGFRAMPAFRSANIDDKSLQLVIEYINNSPVDKVKE